MKKFGPSTRERLMRLIEQVDERGALFPEWKIVAGELDRCEHDLRHATRDLVRLGVLRVREVAGGRQVPVLAERDD